MMRNRFELHEYLNHQQTLYPATIPSIPFLTQALGHAKHSATRGQIYRLLSGIAFGIDLLNDGRIDEVVSPDHDESGPTFRDGLVNQIVARGESTETTRVAAAISLLESGREGGFPIEPPIF